MARGKRPNSQNDISNNKKKKSEPSSDQMASTSNSLSENEVYFLIKFNCDRNHFHIVPLLETNKHWEIDSDIKYVRSKVKGEEDGKVLFRGTLKECQEEKAQLLRTELLDKTEKNAPTIESRKTKLELAQHVEQLEKKLKKALEDLEAERARYASLEQKYLDLLNEEPKEVLNESTSLKRELVERLDKIEAKVSCFFYFV